MYEKKTFGEFMADVINRADRISNEKDGRTLSERYDAPTTVIKMSGAILDTGWDKFLELYKLISTNSYFGFMGSWGAFLGMAVGTTVTSALAYWGGKDSIKVLYNNRELVDAMKTIGDKYESRYNSCSSGSEYDALATEAAEDLYNL